MRICIIFCAFLIIEMVGLRVYAAATYDEGEIAKLRTFLLQESAEAGVMNYEQLGIPSMDDIIWSTVPGLRWNNVTLFLEQVVWADRKLSGDLDLSGFTRLKVLSCSYNDLKTVNVRDCPALYSLDIYTNDLWEIDVTTNPQLNFLRTGYNHFRSIDLSNNPSLIFLCVTGNQIEDLDLSNKAELATLTCSNNQMRTLNVENCVSLESISCGSNQIESLNLYNLPNLETFSGAYNGTRELQLYNCISLRELACNNNSISTLDISGCENLSELKCNNNQLTSLIMEGCERLATIRCENNLLSSLDVSQMPLLTTLICMNNNLSFQTLPIPSEQITTYSYAPQRYIFLENSYDHVDLSDIYTIYDRVSTMNWWYPYGVIRPLKSEEGVFAFDESYVGETLVCQVKNTILPLLVMHYDVTLMPSVGNLNPASSRPEVYASEQSVHVVTDSPAIVSIYTLQGALQLKKTVGEGHTRIPVERGIYGVVVDDKACYKVIVR